MMTFERTYHRRIGIAALLAGIAALSFASGLRAEDAPAPQDTRLEYRTTQRSVLTVQYNVADVAKLRAKAVDILKKTYGLTAAEANAKVTLDGKTNVALCGEYVVIDALAKPTQLKVTASLQQRVEPEPEDVPNSAAQDGTQP